MSEKERSANATYPRVRKKRLISQKWYDKKSMPVNKATISETIIFMRVVYWLD